MVKALHRPPPLPRVIGIGAAHTIKVRFTLNERFLDMATEAMHRIFRFGIKPLSVDGIDQRLGAYIPMHLALSFIDGTHSTGTPQKKLPGSGEMCVDLRMSRMMCESWQGVGAEFVPSRLQNGWQGVELWLKPVDISSHGFREKLRLGLRSRQPIEVDITLRHVKLE
jgi:hypothetical protein